VIEDFQGFCEQLSRYLYKHSFRPDAVFYDHETRVVLWGGRLTTQRVEARSKDSPNATFIRNSTLASLLTFIAANGTVYFNVYVLKGMFNEGESADVLLMGVFLFFVAANSSHISQPLNEVPFASYEKWAVGRREQAKFHSMVTGTLARDLLLGAALTNERRAFTPANIRGSFLPCAPWPCDPVTINRRCSKATVMHSHRGVLHGVATAAASEVIRMSTERTAAAAARLSKGKATVRRNVFQPAVDLLVHHAANVAAEAARVADRATKEAKKKAERVKKSAEVVCKAATKENNTCPACVKTTQRTGAG